METNKQAYDFQLIDFIPFYGYCIHRKRVLKDVKKFGDSIPDNYANQSFVRAKYLGIITGIEALALSAVIIKLFE